MHFVFGQQWQSEIICRLRDACLDQINICLGLFMILFDNEKNREYCQPFFQLSYILMCANTHQNPWPCCCLWHQNTTQLPFYQQQLLPVSQPIGRMDKDQLVAHERSPYFISHTKTHISHCLSSACRTVILYLTTSTAELRPVYCVTTQLWEHLRQGV